MLSMIYCGILGQEVKDEISIFDAFVHFQENIAVILENLILGVNKTFGKVTTTNKTSISLSKIDISLFVPPNLFLFAFSSTYSYF